MARKWDDPDPWNIIAKPILWAVLALGDMFPTVYKGVGVRPQPESQPDPPFTGLRFCQNCKTGTIHNEYFWRIEDETTYECTECDEVYVNG